VNYIFDPECVEIVEKRLKIILKVEGQVSNGKFPSPPVACVIASRSMYKACIETIPRLNFPVARAHSV
jgi:hypothetical protein